MCGKTSDLCHKIKMIKKGQLKNDNQNNKTIFEQFASLIALTAKIFTFQIKY
jgi:hypothetical protein